MRQIVLDTETTGLSASLGHRIIEIGCLELVNRQLTGELFHVYVNPQRAVDEGAFNVHGISHEFLQDKPLFAQIADEFLAFVADSELIIHNAPFDLSFLNAELRLLGHSTPLEQQCTVLDTLPLAKQKHPGQKNNLDALCKRYGVNNSNRAFHGALLDAELLALVYLAMTGGQINLFAQDKTDISGAAYHDTPGIQPKLSSQSPVYYASADELSTHQAYLHWLAEKSG